MSMEPSPEIGDPISERFVGRREALEAFYNRFAYRHMKNGVYYYGEGGLGKTWLLKRIINDNKGIPDRLVTNIIDFFDTENHSIRGLQSTIRTQIGAPEAFAPYDAALQQLEAARSAQNTHPSVIAYAQARASKAFIESCQQAVASREVLLIFDTFEQVQQLDVGRWLLRDFLPEIRGAIVAIAGRPDPAPSWMPDNILSYALQGLDLGDTSQYVRRLDSQITDEDVYNVWERTGGAPLTIDLIFDLPLQQRADLIQSLQTLGPGERIHSSRALQSVLVEQFAHPNRRNRIVWTMTYLKRRFDVRMLKYIVKNDPEFQQDSADDILKDLGRVPYIKEYPNLQSHLLHDEVQRLVAEYVLPTVDNFEPGLVDRLYNLIVDDYYPQTLASAEPSLAQQMRAEMLGYLFDRDVRAGVERYHALLQEIEDSREYGFEELLWGEVRHILPDLPDRGYEIADERGKWLRTHSFFDKAENHYQQMRNMFPERRVAISQSLGFACMRQGKIAEAKREFEESLQFVSADDYETIAMVENNLGQVSQLSGDWESSFAHYNTSFDAAIVANDEQRMVSVYVNRGYLYSLWGKLREARSQCEQAINLMEGMESNKIDPQRAIYARLNLGTAYRHSDDYENAERYYQESLELARKNQNHEATCDALQHLGINVHLWGRKLRRDLKETATHNKQKLLQDACAYQWRAWEYLTASLEIAWQTDDWPQGLADGLDRFAKVYREIDRIERVLDDQAMALQAPEIFAKLQQAAGALHLPLEIDYEDRLVFPGRFESLNWMCKAARLFDLSALVAERGSYFHRALDAWTELSRTLREMGDLEEVALIIRRIERDKGGDYQSELYSAIAEIGRGTLDFVRGKHQDALDKFTKAYASFAKQSSYPAYLLEDNLRDLEWRLHELPPNESVRWCNVMAEAWAADSIFLAHPEMRDMIERMRLEAKRRSRPTTAEPSR